MSNCLDSVKDTMLCLLLTNLDKSLHMLYQIHNSLACHVLFQEVSLYHQFQRTSLDSLFYWDTERKEKIVREKGSYFASLAEKFAQALTLKMHGPPCCDSCCLSRLLLIGDFLYQAWLSWTKKNNENQLRYLKFMSDSPVEINKF